MEPWKKARNTFKKDKNRDLGKTVTVLQVLLRKEEASLLTFSFDITSKSTSKCKDNCDIKL
jgi:hypothetical protein